MEICSRFTGMERKNGAFLLHTDNADVKVCFVTDEIVRVRASFDHELAEESYVLMTTAWEDRIKLLPDAALYRSTLIHHTPEFYVKSEQRSFCSAQNPASFGVKLAYGVVFTGNSSKEKARNFSYHQEVSGFILLKLEIYCSIGFIVGTMNTSRTA